MSLFFEWCFIMNLKNLHVYNLKNNFNLTKSGSNNTNWMWKKVPRDMNLLVMRSNLLRRRLHRIWSCDQPSCWLFFNQEWNVIWRSDTLMVNALFNVLRGDSGDPRQQDLQQSLLWQPLSKQWCLWAGQVPGLPLSLSPTESWLHLPSRWVHFKILLSNLTVRQEH